MTRYCLALDLKDDPTLIERYKAWHRPEAVPEPIVRSIRDAGIQDMQIWLTGARLFMIMEVGPGFSFEAKEVADAASEDVQAWERLMWEFQQPLPGAAPGEKWVRMERIYALNAAS